MLKGLQTWVFDSQPVITGSSAIGGPFEGKGALAHDFDLLHEDLWLGQSSYEKAERKMLEEACERALMKAGLTKEAVQFFLCGDLINQVEISNFAARTLGIPFMGIYGACSTSMEGLALAALIVESKFAMNAMAATSSHNAATEKQYRYPTEYGAQKPPTAQWTVTGAGAAVVSQKGNGPKVTSATIGRVIDMGLTDPFNMGGAMAPAAVDTILAHFRDLSINPLHYDLIATGDLGKIGHSITEEILTEQGFGIPHDKFVDCGMLIYKSEQEVFSGGSGCGCSATVTYGHILNRMRRGELKRVLIVATGALLSPMSYQQKETIPCVAHAVGIEM